MNKTKSLLLIGTLPPPIGGVSIHIKRLYEKLLTTDRVTILFDVKYLQAEFSLQLIRSLFIFIKLIRNHDLIHDHSSNIYFSTFICLFAKLYGKRYIKTIHSLRDDFGKIFIIKKFFYFYLLDKSNYLIFVGSNEYYKVKKWNKKLVENSSIISPFILPLKKNINVTDEKYIQVKHKITVFSSNLDFTICVNAFKIVFLDDGTDLYGLDHSIELIKKLAISHNKKIGLVIFIPQIGDSEYYNFLLQMIQEANIEERVLFINEEVPLISFLEQMDLFIRPTASDSYGISIAEALSLGTVSIASNVCKRPTGTILFEKRNISNLYKVVCDVIINLDKYKKKLEDILFPDSFLAIEKIYNLND